MRHFVQIHVNFACDSLGHKNVGARQISGIWRNSFRFFRENLELCAKMIFTRVLHFFYYLQLRISLEL